jgi:hypothetical protein
MSYPGPPYLEERVVAGERRLGIVDDDGVWWMLRRERGEPRVALPSPATVCRICDGRDEETR